jgi:hypothetical protein
VRKTLKMQILRYAQDDNPFLGDRLFLQDDGSFLIWVLETSSGSLFPDP